MVTSKGKPTGTHSFVAGNNTQTHFDLENPTPHGYGSKFNHQEMDRRFKSLATHLPGFYLGFRFFTHSRVEGVSSGHHLELRSGRLGPGRPVAPGPGRLLGDWKPRGASVGVGGGGWGGGKHLGCPWSPQNFGGVGASLFPSAAEDQGVKNSF